MGKPVLLLVFKLGEAPMKEIPMEKLPSLEHYFLSFSLYFDAKIYLATWIWTRRKYVFEACFRLASACLRHVQLPHPGVDLYWAFFVMVDLYCFRDSNLEKLHWKFLRPLGCSSIPLAFDLIFTFNPQWTPQSAGCEIRRNAFTNVPLQRTE